MAFQNQFAPVVEDFDLDLNLDLDSDVADDDDLVDNFSEPFIGDLLSGIELDSAPWQGAIGSCFATFRNIPVLDGIYTKIVDGVGVVYAVATTTQYAAGADKAVIQVAYDQHQRLAYSSVVTWGGQWDDSWIHQPAAVSAKAETPDVLVDRATRGLYACEWGTVLLREAVARCALVARGQVEAIPVWMVERAVSELDGLAREFQRGN